ncbi:MAG: hypothetical protein K8S94_13230 [Planctomycetia bacterium]|nr:hypothetical protein [Planctomycetia bacterium]
MPALARWAAVGAAALLATGCGRDAEVRPGDIRFSTVPKQAEPAPVAAPPREEPAAAARLTFDVPDGWQDAGASGMRLATLLMGDPADRNEVTIIPAAGTLASNVERWQGQLDAAGDPEAIRRTAAAAVAGAEKVDVDGAEASVVLLLDAEATASQDSGQAILGAMIPVDDSTSLFVKYKGAVAVARRERDAFIRFVSSIRWKQ